LVHEEGDTEFVAKVADLGLARNVENYYVASSSNFAVKWAAPEVLEFKKFSAKSDVFAFAVTCYEILTLGNKPWGKLSNEDAGEKVLDGERVGPFPSASDELQAFFNRCMEEEADDRPDFSEVEETFQTELQRL
jgi:tyrosine-protein kinase Tec